jgi:hypothetical protein
MLILRMYEYLSQLFFFICHLFDAGAILPLILGVVSKCSVAFCSELKLEQMNHCVLLHPPVSDWVDPALVVYFFGMAWEFESFVTYSLRLGFAWNSTLVCIFPSCSP